MKTKHTPTPWSYFKSEGEKVSIEKLNENPKCPVSKIATLHKGNPYPCGVDYSEANAEYIVKCVNNHEALLEAVKEMRERLEKLSFAANHLPRKYAAEIYELATYGKWDKAIQQAEGGKS